MSHDMRPKWAPKLKMKYHLQLLQKQKDRYKWNPTCMGFPEHTGAQGGTDLRVGELPHWRVGDSTRLVCHISPDPCATRCNPYQNPSKLFVDPKMTKMYMEREKKQNR